MPSETIEAGLVGRTIKAVRPLTKAELEYEGWDGFRRSPVVALELDNGELVYASCDPDGNAPGAMFIRNPKTNVTFMLS